MFRQGKHFRMPEPREGIQGRPFQEREGTEEQATVEWSHWTRKGNYTAYRSNDSLEKIKTSSRWIASIRFIFRSSWVPFPLLRCHICLDTPLSPLLCPPCGSSFRPTEQKNTESIFIFMLLCLPRKKIIFHDCRFSVFFPFHSKLQLWSGGSLRYLQDGFFIDVALGERLRASFEIVISASNCGNIRDCYYFRGVVRCECDVTKFMKIIPKSE